MSAPRALRLRRRAVPYRLEGVDIFTDDGSPQAMQVTIERPLTQAEEDEARRLADE